MKQAIRQIIFDALMTLAIGLFIILIYILIHNIDLIRTDPILYGAKSLNYSCTCIDNLGKTHYFNTPINLNITG